MFEQKVKNSPPPIFWIFCIFCIFGGGAGCRSQNRTQREKSLSNMGVKCTMYPAPCTQHHAPCTQHHVPCTMYHAPCTMHHVPKKWVGANAPCTQHHVPSTMYPAPCTMHHIPCTMHHAPCTMHHAYSTRIGIGIFGIFGGRASYRVQIRNQREKSVSDMDVNKNPKTIFFLTSRIRCADMPQAFFFCFPNIFIF